MQRRLHGASSAGASKAPPRRLRASPAPGRVPWPLPCLPRPRSRPPASPVPPLPNPPATAVWSRGGWGGPPTRPSHGVPVVPARHLDATGHTSRDACKKQGEGGVSRSLGEGIQRPLDTHQRSVGPRRARASGPFGRRPAAPPSPPRRGSSPIAPLVLPPPLFHVKIEVGRDQHAQSGLEAGLWCKPRGTRPPAKTRRRARVNGGGKQGCEQRSHREGSAR